MSTLQVEVCTVDEIKEHPNADKLELAIIRGWQTCISKGSYQVGDKVVYFPPDTLLPESWTDKFGVTKYCNYQFILDNFIKYIEKLK